MLISSWFFLVLRRLNVILPALLITFVLISSFPHYQPMTWIGCALFAAYGVVSLFCFRYGLVDAVWDQGNVLLVKDRWRHAYIPLSAIKSLYVTEGTSPASGTIRLRESSIFGYEVRFAVAAPLYSINSHAARRLKALQRRLDQIADHLEA